MRTNESNFESLMGKPYCLHILYFGLFNAAIVHSCEWGVLNGIDR